MREHLLYWYRDLFLGAWFGIALLWASFNALHWTEFRFRLLSHMTAIAIAFAAALLSPRRLLTVFVGLCFPLARGIFLVFVVENVWAALGVLAWASLFVWIGFRLERRYAEPDIGMPEQKDTFNTLAFMGAIGSAGLCAYVVRKVVGL